MDKQKQSKIFNPEFKVAQQYEKELKTNYEILLGRVIAGVSVKMVKLIKPKSYANKEKSNTPVS
jgi:hypothetical protein